MTPDNTRPARLLGWNWYLAIAIALLAVAGCSPTMPDNAPQATGEPVVAAEVQGNWFRLTAQGEPVVDVLPVVIEGVVAILVDELIAQIPEMTEDHPLYMHVSEALDGGAVADASTGGYVATDLPSSQQVVPVEQPDGSLLFEDSGLETFLQQAMPDGRPVADWNDPEDGFSLSGMPVSDVSAKLWLYRVAGSDETHFRASAQAAIEVPLAGRVEVRVSLDGVAEPSDGPEADGFVPGTLSDLPDWPDPNVLFGS